MAQLIGPDFTGLQADDLEAARKFPPEVVGLTVRPALSPDAVVFETKPIPFAVRKPLLGHAVPIAFAPKDGPFGCYFAFRDPFGHTITAHTSRRG